MRNQYLKEEVISTYLGKISTFRVNYVRFASDLKGINYRTVMFIESITRQKI